VWRRLAKDESGHLREYIERIFLDGEGEAEAGFDAASGGAVFEVERAAVGFGDLAA